MAFFASSDDAFTSFCCIGSTIAVIALIMRKKDQTPPSLPSMPASVTPPPLWQVDRSGSGSPALFDPFRDARVAGGIQGVKNFLLPGEGKDLVESVTLNDDFIAVAHANGEVTAYLLDASLVASLQLGAMSEYPPSRYHITLSRGKETVSFPVSFHGWLNLFDACKNAGGTVEAAEEISDEMRIKVLGPKGANRIASAAKTTAPARPSKCPSCGAALNKRGPCDYCGNTP